ncbi:Fe-S cluster assembly protein SufD [Gemmatimonas sp. UBA7669]|uniref:Fe-S cluster assembly protein SufD n=1 Tax=Gemmatimonas sp. UBA7669 TaxID=1946568 RepID=UPI0025B966AA|nr:Fe-S cluster assembly protein SufD [Gemmatimonas sp. UBA7669]
MTTGLRFAEQAVAASVADAPGSLKGLRAAGAEAFKTLGFPTTRNEDWHYTNVSAIATAQYTPAADVAPVSLDAAALEPYTFGGTWPLVVFVNGRFNAELSRLDALPAGISVRSLADASVDDAEALGAVLGTAATADRDGFTALNAAFAGEGTYIRVSKEMVIDTPIHLLHVTDARGEGLMSHPRHVLVAERHAKAMVVESHIGLANVPYFTNAVVEAFVEDGATLQLIRVQREARTAHHVGTVEARQGRDSHFVTFTFQTGAALSRSNVYTVLNGEGCGCTINGLYMLDGEQHGDHQTRVEHVKENCFSREAYKGLIDDSAHGVFNGKVYVHPEAQKTDGKQTNHTLLLSEKAQIDTKPQLEIFADDVKCTHGATVGRIDETSLFYLKSRGVGKVLARQLLMYAFAADVLETIEHPVIVDALEKLTVERFTGSTTH